MWKFHDFSITQILREINFWDSWSAKSAILTHLEALNFNFYDFFQFCILVGFRPSKSAKIHQYQKSEPLNVLKWQTLHFKKTQN